MRKHSVYTFVMLFSLLISFLITGTSAVNSNSSNQRGLQLLSTVSINANSTLISLGESVLFTSTISDVSPPYYGEWYVNETYVTWNMGDNWIYTPTVEGVYRVYLYISCEGGGGCLSNVITFKVLSITHTLTVPDDYPTIQEAINAASDGNTVFVRNGTYYENVVVNKTVSLNGENRDNTIINGNQSVEDNFAFLINRTNGVVVEGFTMQNCKSGVFLLESDYCRISNNIMLNCTWEGVWVYGSHDDFVNSNFFNTSYWGVYIVGESDTNSNDNIIFSNIFDSNSMGAVGITRSTNDTVSSNLITKNSIGIDILTDAYNNLIIANTLQDNGIGLSFYLSDNETLYHNNFINNTVNVDNSPSHNKWDNGCEGNYWSNYVGNDSNNDGIGDIPYIIDSNNTDNYPLMNVYWSPCDINHDLKVDMKDIGAAARAFNTRPGDEFWNPHADITGIVPLVPDGTVDMRDISLIARHFGDNYP